MLKKFLINRYSDPDKNERKSNMLDWLIIFGCILIPIIVSWAIVNGVVWLICLCFGWGYNILIGTGIWLICMIARWIFSAAKGA